MAYEYLGPYQLPALADADPVGFVDHSEALAIAVNNGLGSVAGQAAEETSEVADSVTALGPGYAKLSILPGTTDLNTFNVSGLHRISTDDTGTIQNLPPGMRSAGILENMVTGTPGQNSWWVQRMEEYGDSPRSWRRSSSNTSGGWGPWSLVDEQARDVTEWHVFLAAGQSNMQGAGPITSTQAGRYMVPRVAQFGYTRRVLETARVPLDMNGTASALSPATTFAHNYLRNQPPHVGVLLVPAARGGTGFTNSTTTYTWTPGVATQAQYGLPELAVQQTKDAIAAARATGAIVDLKGILWHQGENNSSSSTASYAAALDNLIGWFRTQLDSAFLPFVVGQMVPEGIAAVEGRPKIDLAHQQTPGRVIYTGFAPATLGGHNPGDTTHMSKAGVEYIGRTYLEAYGRALSNDGTEGVLPDNVAELDVNGKLPAAYFPDNIKPTTNGAAPVGKGELFKSVDDYRLAGDTTDAGAISRAHAANKAVLYPRGKEHDSGFYQNLYGGTYQNALGPRIMSGSTAAPVVDADPIMWVQKYSSANRLTNAAEWDQGAGYFALHKQSGNAFGAGLTGYARHGSVDGGQLVGVHGRAYAAVAESEAWGMWAYAWGGSDTYVPKTIIGIEVDIVNRAPGQGWTVGGGQGSSVGMLMATADNGNNVSQGILIGKGLSAPGKFYSAIVVKGDGVVPSGANSSTAVTNNEAIRLNGAALISDSYNGFRFGPGNFGSGVSFTEATFRDNAAIVFGEGHRIVVGPGAAAGKYLEFSNTNSRMNMKDIVLAFNGTQVVSGRKTGWNSTTGTPLRGTFTADTATLIQTAQTLAALITDLRAHGLIGT